jgi:transcriptional regulator of arginine metabolism
MNKSKRQFALKEVVGHQALATQEELCDALAKAGFPVTQATLSRDLKELGIVRANSPDGPQYVVHHESEERRLQPFIGFEIDRIEANEVMIIIKTLPGRAAGVASFIDALHYDDILGTIAGDDTIFVTPASTKRIRSMLKFLRYALIARGA